jgi:hypothetical protein
MLIFEERRCAHYGNTEYTVDVGMKKFFSSERDGGPWQALAFLRHNGPLSMIYIHLSFGNN